MSSWLLAFALTLTIEGAVAAVWLRRAEPRLVRRLTVALFANLATHPLVWFGFPELPLPPIVELPLAEAFAVAAEALFLIAFVPGLRRRSAAALSLVANVASFGVGYFAYTYLEAWRLL